MIAEKLRKAILQAAMQGKLTEQLPEDGNARDLLAEIQQEKKRKIKAGEIKATGPLSPMLISEEPFDIPENWIWAKLGELVDIGIGRTPSRQQPKYWSGGKYNWIAISDMVPNGIVNHTKELVSQLAFTECFKEKLCPKGTLIMSFKLTIGRVSIVGEPSFHNEAIISIYPLLLSSKKDSFSNYLFKVLPEIALTGDTKGAIKGSTLNSKSIRNLLVPVPPSNEQNRIVTRIDQVMPLIDELERAEEELDALEKEFPDKLKKSLLQAAMQGRLTEQLPEDGDARDLLAEIQNEKKRKIKAGEIKPTKPLPPIDPEELPHEIPSNWTWTKLGELVMFENGDRGKHYAGKEKWTASGIPFINAGSLNNTYLDDASVNYIDERTFNKLRSGFIKKGDILFCLRGSLGKFAINEIFEKGTIGSSLVILRKHPGLETEYLRFYFSSPLIKLMIRTFTTGSAQPNLSASNVNNFIFPLPPIQEQLRVINRLTPLLYMINQLEKTWKQ
ncbi:MAG TPA: hypothetical protein DDZ66_09085 [Firmicutes bacterium]|nr:hypothetical protein [Bacillota bacterium]